MTVIKVDSLSDATEKELSPLIGECVVSIESSEHSLTLRFENGYELTLSGARWEGCSLGVEVSKDGKQIL